ncbi:MAG TPA: energy transducer TonB [Candidatus Angelobacter sp.]|nr:energy transducer TonB [Candidatus Angelobacter sp.]
MNRSTLLLPAFLLTCAVMYACAQASEPSRLPSPAQVSPPSQAHAHGLSGFPYTVVCNWSSVPGAKEYGIETTDYFYRGWSGPTFMARVKDPTFTINLGGPGSGTWRVWAIDKDDHPGQVSAWSVFTFYPDKQPIPTPPPDTSPDFSRLPATVSVPTPYQKIRSLPVFDPKTGEACHWPASGVAGASVPKAIYNPEPEPTEEARKARESGDVELAVDIGEDGLVKRVCILRTAPREDLGKQALNIVRTWRFEPAKKDGTSIPYSMSVQISFNLGR